MDYYDRVNEKLIDLLNNGVVPWSCPWKIVSPRNPITGTIYKGRNMLLFNAAPYDNCNWITYNEAEKLGGFAKKGQKSWPVIWFGNIPKKDSNGEKTESTFPLLKGYPIFNVEQIEGVSFPNPEIQILKFNPISAAEKIVSEYNFPTEFGGNRACYSPSSHIIRMPMKERFSSESSYYSVMFHEMAHSTSKELKRPMNTSKGSKQYAFEELIAQITSSYLCAECNLDPSLLEMDAAYLQNWMYGIEWKEFIAGDKTMFLRASSQARKAFAYICGKELKEEE